jgi:carboxylesterase
MRVAAQITCPVLVIHARDDELTSLKSAEFIARNARVVVLENSYHMVCVDNDRKQVTASVLDFLGVVKREATAAEPLEMCSRAGTGSLASRFMIGMREDAL